MVNLSCGVILRGGGGIHGELILWCNIAGGGGVFRLVFRAWNNLSVML